MRAVAVAVCVALLGVAAADVFFVMGDWGGQQDSPYTTFAEQKVAKAMQAGAAASGATFTVVLGDNFYQEGIETDVSDPRFKTTFEDVFTGPALQGPAYQFYILAGNHDHYGNVSAEIAYSSLSSRWIFPSLYYTFTKTTSDGLTIQFVMIDTVILTGNSDLPGGGQLAGDALPGPANVAEADAQWTWINKTLATSTADFLIVAGHYPVWSVCEHGPTSLLVSTLKPLLEQYKVTAYLAGHDHCVEYVDEGLGVQYHGIGASHGCDASQAHMSSVPAGSLKYYYDAPPTDDKLADDQILTADDVNPAVGAFASVSVSSKGFIVKHLTDTGKVLYTAPTLPSRNA